MSNDYKEGVVSLERGIYLGRDLKGVWDFDDWEYALERESPRPGHGGSCIWFLSRLRVCMVKN